MPNHSKMPSSLPSGGRKKDRAGRAAVGSPRSAVEKISHATMDKAQRSHRSQKPGIKKGKKRILEV